MKNTNWFKDAIIYQIYPRSFKDSNGDGIGDIKGIISKLDYLKDLGINCVWLSPVYESPMDDNGYDISDYKAIHKDFGTMEDFKLMLHEMHKRGIRLIMDLVANHTSDEHPWFKESRKSKDNPYRDYYIWKDKPNNWTGFFGEKAWEYVEECDSYYLHLFGKKQPDVNWENPKVREAYKDIIKFYLDLGVDGFRCDVINVISKDQRFKNGSNPLILVGKKYFINGPKLHDYLQEINKDVLSNYDCMTVGETVFTTLDDMKLLTAEDRNELSMVFNFDHTSVDNFLGVKWLMRKFSLKRFKKSLDKYQYGLKDVGWNSLFYENHDQRRSVGRFNTDDSKYRVESAKLLATTMYFLKGTPFIYQGQEIGMTNLNVDSLEDFVDLETHNVLKLMKSLPLSKKYIDKSIRNGSRDNARTPMQWDNTTNAGFSSSTPWLMVNNNYKSINVEKSIKDDNSILNYYKKLIKIYKKYSYLVREGEYKDLYPNSSKLFAYERRKDNELLLVVSNFSNKPKKIRLLKKYKGYRPELLLNNYKHLDEKELKPYQSILIHLKKK
ncbi:MAG: alpha-glucosidase [Bacilli bacterium]|nr:alpha-glucosidase [Bacilli bacterium]